MIAALLHPLQYPVRAIEAGSSCVRSQHPEACILNLTEALPLYIAERQGVRFQQGSCRMQLFANYPIGIAAPGCTDDNCIMEGTHPQEPIQLLLILLLSKVRLALTTKLSGVWPTQWLSM